MSVSISAIQPVSASLDSLDVSSAPKKPLPSSTSASGNAHHEALAVSQLNNKPLPGPTAAQQIQNLALTGQPASVIATSLGIPIAQVEADLGVTATDAAQASAVTELAGRLSIQA